MIFPEEFKTKMREKIKRGEMTQQEYNIEMVRRATNLSESERYSASVRGAQNTIK
jgi:hypothetical protein